MYDVKETFQASSAAEAVELLTAHPGAVLVAGGTDVMIRLKKRKLREAVLVSLQHLRNFRMLFWRTTVRFRSVPDAHLMSWSIIRCF